MSKVKVNEAAWSWLKLTGVKRNLVSQIGTGNYFMAVVTTKRDEYSDMGETPEEAIDNLRKTMAKKTRQIQMQVDDLGAEREYIMDAINSEAFKEEGLLS